MIDLLQIGIKYNQGSLDQLLGAIPRMTDLLRSEFNTELVKEKIVDELWLQIVERLYA